MFQRQYGLCQFVPATHGLDEVAFPHDSKNLVDRATNLGISWRDGIHRTPSLLHIGLCTPEYALWQKERVKDMRPPSRIDHKRKLGPNSEDMVAHMDAEIKRLKNGSMVSDLEENLAAYQSKLSELQRSSEEQQRTLRWEADMANYARDQIFRQYKEEKEKAFRFDQECKEWVKKHTAAKGEAQWYKNLFEKKRDKQAFETNQIVKELNEQLENMTLEHGKEKQRWEQEKKQITAQRNEEKKERLALRATKQQVLVNYQQSEEALRNLVLVTTKTSKECIKLQKEKGKLLDDLSEETEKAYEWYQQTMGLEEHLTACREDLDRKIDELVESKKEVKKLREVLIKTCSKSDGYELAYFERKDQVETLLRQVGEIIVVVKNVRSKAESMLRSIAPVGLHGQETVDMLEQIIAQCGQIRNFYKYSLTEM